MTATAKLTKVAVIRPKDGALYLNCRCGAKPETPLLQDRKGEVVCSCGQRYTTNGYLLPSPTLYEVNRAWLRGEITTREHDRQAAQAVYIASIK